MRRVAAVDVGTNSTRLLIADSDGSRLVEHRREAAVTRLGEGVDASRRLREEAIERVLAVLDRYQALAREAGAETVAMAATSAVRDAVNGREFASRVQGRYGVELRILSGVEEAALTRRGVGATDERTLVLDVGGGSTELMCGDFTRSVDVGSVRLSERFLHSDPPTPAELEAARSFVSSLLPELPVARAIGVAGTVTQLHELIGELTLEALEQETERLASMPLEERRRLANMDPERAPVIVGGALIVLEALRRYRLESIGWSVHDLLDGIVFDAAERLSKPR